MESCRTRAQSPGVATVPSTATSRRMGVLVAMGELLLVQRDTSDLATHLSHAQALVVEPATGHVRAAIELPGLPGYERSWTLVDAPGGPWFLTTQTPFRLLRWDLDLGALEEGKAPPIPAEQRPYNLAESGGELYYGDGADDPLTGEYAPTLRALDLATGLPIDLQLSVEEWGQFVRVYAIEPTDGGVLVQSADEGIHRYDALSGEWELVPSLWAEDALPWTTAAGEGTRLAARSESTGEGSWFTTHFVLDAEGQWHLAADPFAAVAWEPSWSRTIAVDGAIWYLDHDYDGDIGTLQPRVRRVRLPGGVRTPSTPSPR